MATVVTEPFLHKKPGIIKRMWRKVFKKKERVNDTDPQKDKRQPGDPIKRDLEEHLFILMKNNGTTEIIEGVNPGEFMIPSEEGVKAIDLTPEKLTSIQYGGQYYRGWVGHEDNRYPYPEEPRYGARMIRQIVEKLALNYKDLKEADLEREKTKRWLLIGVVALIVIVLFASNPEWLSNIGAALTGKAKEAVINTTIQGAPLP